VRVGTKGGVVAAPDERGELLFPELMAELDACSPGAGGPPIAATPDMAETARLAHFGHNR